MLSSFETEMPSSTGVFPPEISQPYMPAEIEQKLAEAIRVRLNFPSVLSIQDKSKEFFWNSSYSSNLQNLCKSILLHYIPAYNFSTLLSSGNKGVARGTQGAGHPNRNVVLGF